MMNIMLQVLFLAVLTLSASDEVNVSGEVVDSKQVVVTGTVIGYSIPSSLRSISGRSVAWPHDVLMVRVDNESGELRKGQYIKVSYKATAEHYENLPAAMFERSSRWRFELTRDKSCDESMRGFIYGDKQRAFGDAEKFPALLRVKGAEGEKLPEDITLKCYSFNWGSYKESD